MLLMFFRVNASFLFFVDKMLVGLNHGNFLRLQNMITEVVRDSLLLMAVRVNDGLELEVMDPKEHKGDVEQEEG